MYVNHQSYCIQMYELQNLSNQHDICLQSKLKFVFDLCRGHKPKIINVFQSLIHFQFKIELKNYICPNIVGNYEE